MAAPNETVGGLGVSNNVLATDNGTDGTSFATCGKVTRRNQARLRDGAKVAITLK